MLSTTPFHAGEIAVQSRLGVRDEIEPFARRMVRPDLPDEHRQFYATLPFMVAAARDAAGRPWATLLANKPGFISSGDEHSITINARLNSGDALADHLDDGADLGLLGIEFATRRRNRVNGRVTRQANGKLHVNIDQSFGNCPQYIHAREWVVAPEPRQATAQRHQNLTPQLSEWVKHAGTFFIASGFREDGEQPYFGMDASHRGGDPGFVTVLDEATLLWPDYAGNNHFNTIGNLVKDPRVGVLFVDFEQGHMLQITGRASIDWDSQQVADTLGARRLIRISIEDVVELRDALPIRWLPAQGTVRSLRLIEKHRESDDVVSFVMAARDGGELPDYAAGQYLPIEIAIPGQPQKLTRTYSLSAKPHARTYQISVKRDAAGVVSQYLHDRIVVGDILNAHAPGGEFTLVPGDRPVVLISAGIGVTPMISMLETLSEADDRRDIWFIHGVRNSNHHPFADRVRKIAAGNPRVNTRTVYSRPNPDDQMGKTFDALGRLNADLIARTLPTLAAEFYVCGPSAFSLQLTEELCHLGVSEAQIHNESFG